MNISPLELIQFIRRYHESESLQTLTYIMTITQKKLYELPKKTSSMEYSDEFQWKCEPLTTSWSEQRAESNQVECYEKLGTFLRFTLSFSLLPANRTLNSFILRFTFIYFHKNFSHSTSNIQLFSSNMKIPICSQIPTYPNTYNPPAYLLIMWIYIFFSLIFLSSSPLARLIFVQQENIGLVVPWMLGVLTFMSLEAVATVYQNILRDHINGVSFVYLKFQILSPSLSLVSAPAVSRYPVCVYIPTRTF